MMRRAKTRVLNPTFGFSSLLFICLFPALSYGSDVMILGKPSATPFGHHQFCQNQPSLCKAGKASSPEQLTSARMSKLAAVNASVNNSIKAMDDSKQYGEADVWAIKVKSGDCEDYALAKRSRLISAGYKPGNLRLTMVKTRDGTPHIVLVVRSDQGDLVLDNMHNKVLPWRKSGLRFLKTQAQGGGKVWVSVRG